MEQWPNFTPVEHLDYRAKCDLARASIRSFSQDIEKGQVISAFDSERQNSGIWAQILRMFTVYPYKDMTWIVAVLFAVGSLDFTINAFFGLLPLVAPSTTFDTEATVAVPATITIGATMFVTGGFLAVFDAFNADRGVFEMSKLGEDMAIERRPALIGSKERVWFPPFDDFKRLLLYNRPFQSGLVQLFGGLILTTSAVAGFPGVLDPMDPVFPTLVFWPQVIGGAMFFLANMMLVFYEQDKWYKPKPLDPNWQASLQNGIGGFGFMITGVFLLYGAILESSIAAFVGSWTFFIGSLIQWYVVMEIY